MIGVLALTVFLSSCYAGTVLEFTATPPVTIKSLTMAVNMHCGVTDVEKRVLVNHPEDIAQVHSIFITNDKGKSIATVGEKDAASVLLSDGGLTATGNVNGMAYLDLNFTSPSEMTPGVYQCTMKGFSTNHVPVQLVKTWRLTTREPTIHDVVTDMRNTEDALAQQVSDLEVKNTNLEQNVIDLQQKLEQANSALATRLDRLEASNGGLTSDVNDITQLKSQVDKLSACTEVRVAFRAALPFGRDQLYKNTTLKYTEVKENVNNNYNPATGVFTASEPGMYRFDLYAFIETNDAAYLYIANNGQRVASLASTAAYRWKMDSTGVTLHLNEGDEVKVVSRFGWSIHHKLRQQKGIYDINYFSGELLQSDKCRP